MSRDTNRKERFAMYCVTLLNCVGISLFSPLINKQIHGLGISGFTLGIVGSIYGGMQMIAIPLLGQATKCYGSKTVYLFAMTCTCVSNFMQALTSSSLIFIVTRSTTGLWRHTMSLGKSVLVDLTEKQEIPFVVGNYITFSHLGVIIGPIIGGRLSQYEENVPMICLSAGSTYILIFVLMNLILTPKTRENLNSAPTSALASTADTPQCSILQRVAKYYWSILGIRNREVVCKLFINFCIVFANQTIRAMFPMILMRKHGASVSDISYLNSLQSIVSVSMGFCIRPVISKFYNRDYRKVLVQAGILHVISFIGQVTSTTFLMAGLSILLLETAFTFLVVALVGITVESRQKVDEIFLAKEFVSSLALLMGPASAGYAQTFLGINGAAGFGAVSSFVAVSCAFLFIPSRFKSD